MTGTGTERARHGARVALTPLLAVAVLTAAIVAVGLRGSDAPGVGRFDVGLVALLFIVIVALPVSMLVDPGEDRVASIGLLIFFMGLAGGLGRILTQAQGWTLIASPDALNVSRIQMAVGGAILLIRLIYWQHGKIRDWRAIARRFAVATAVQVLLGVVIYAVMRFVDRG